MDLGAGVRVVQSFGEELALEKAMANAFKRDHWGLGVLKHFLEVDMGNLGREREREESVCVCVWLKQCALAAASQGSRNRLWLIIGAIAFYRVVVS